MSRRLVVLLILFSLGVGFAWAAEPASPIDKPIKTIIVPPRFPLTQPVFYFRLKLPAPPPVKLPPGVDVRAVGTIDPDTIIEPSEYSALSKTASPRMGTGNPLTGGGGANLSAAGQAAQIRGSLRGVMTALGL